MTKTLTMKVSTLSWILRFIPITCFLFHSCRPGKAVDAEVNKSFEMAPPLAEEIQVRILEKKIDGANILVAAKLDPVVIKSNFHAVMVGDQKIMMRDDGKKGDEKAVDGIYSVVLKEDEVALQKDLEGIRDTAIKRLKNGKPVFQWVNRSAVPVSDKLKNLELQEFDLKKGIRFHPSLFFTVSPDPALKDHSLTITDLGVVEDPSRTYNSCTNTGTVNGAWTFSKLMGDMANTASTGVSAENFVKDWLDKYMTSGNVNSDPIPGRSMGMFDVIILPWVRKSNPDVPWISIQPGNWKTFPLDLKFAPFKLLAIVNRVDLRGNGGYSISNAGEGRFVFGLLSETCTRQSFTVIFEYGIPKTTCASLKGFAKEWYDLKDMTPGSTAYNDALQLITDQFTAAGAGLAGKPNGSSLNQVRTDDLALSDEFFWELREFNIDAATHKLFLTSVKQTPAKKFNSSTINPVGSATDFAILADYVNTNEVSIIANNYEVPLSFGANPFLGGKAHTDPGGFWRGATTAGPAFITNNEARHVFSLNTCNGCHGGETSTSFTHISPANFGTQANLSRFLTGDPAETDGLFKVTDPAGRPAGSPTVRGFNDLERRASDLENFVNNTCKKVVIGLIDALSFKPTKMVH